MLSRARVLTSRVAYKGKVLQVKVDRIVEPGGVEARREVVCHGGSVVVLPLLADGKVLLIRQFRYPALQPLWELVAGGINPGERPAQAAARELVEETGYRARVFKPILDFFPSPGFLNERMHLFEARGLTAGKAEPEADERILARMFRLPELRKLVRSNRIKDGKTLVGLLWLFQQTRWRV